MRSSLVVMALLLPGCVSARADLIGNERFPPRPADHPIEVYDSLADITRPFIKVARVSGQGAPAAGWDSVLEEMKDEVRAAGGDALVLMEDSRIATGVSASGAVTYRKQRTGVAIRWN